MKCYCCKFYDASVDACNADDVCYADGYEKGYAEGSLAVTEEIINEKVIKGLEGKKQKLIKLNENLSKHLFIGTLPDVYTKIKFIDELIFELQGKK